MKAGEPATVSHLMTQHAPYVLEQRPEELARLIAYAEREAEDVRMVCRRVALGRGGRAIDVGCGPLGAAARPRSDSAACRRVGASRWAHRLSRYRG